MRVQGSGFVVLGLGLRVAPPVIGAIRRDVTHDITLSETVRRARRCWAQLRLRARVTTPPRLASTSAVSLTPGVGFRLQGLVSCVGG